MQNSFLKFRSTANHCKTRRLLSQFVRSASSATNICFTDPYLIYQGLIKNGTLQKDEHQVRAIKEFQKLYLRCLDYKPDAEATARLALVLNRLEEQQSMQQCSRWWDPKLLLHQTNLGTALIRVLLNEQLAADIKSPLGLMVHGEVGCGKLMLMDLFAQLLPHQAKQRWHYHNFILWVYSRMHEILQRRQARRGFLKAPTLENDFILFEIAQELLLTTTILMLDEFMLPDVAAARIVQILFTYYFRLGGVLVATSNKLPEDLYDNKFNRERLQVFASLIRTRCDLVNMLSNTDYRMLGCKRSIPAENRLVVGNRTSDVKQWNQLVENVIQAASKNLSHAAATSASTVQPTPSRCFVVSGRPVCVDAPFGKTCVLDFTEWCSGLHSANEYISMSARYTTVMLFNVPVMRAQNKNAAKRFITLIDALYEARCQLYMHASVPLDQLFDFSAGLPATALLKYASQEQEMYSKTFMSPYRPNVSSYDNKHAEKYIDKTQADYTKLKEFTGEDEKFAYKRALLRIHEMIFSARFHATEHMPPSKSQMPWEKSQESPEQAPGKCSHTDKQRPDINRISIHAQSPPSFTSHNHFWAMGEWTSTQGRRLRDQIARRWIRLSIREGF